MALSMTGYGRGEAKNASAAVVLELKSVNHRYFEAVMNLSAPLWSLEHKIKERLRSVLQRGHVEVWLQISAASLERKVPVVDTALAKQYAAAFRHLSKSLGLADTADVRWVAAFPEVVRLESRPLPVDRIEPLVNLALAKAVRRLLAMRSAEGKRLVADIRQRLRGIRRVRQEIEVRVLANIRQQKNERQKANTAGARPEAELKNGNTAPLRCDVTEELVRLNSHVVQFAKFLTSRRPVGRALDFLIQEMNREINTIGSKSMDAVIAHRVVTVKEELEKIREQVQNIE
jgi:uncharacterized protein (TIGR00255 family)